MSRVEGKNKWLLQMGIRTEGDLNSKCCRIWFQIFNEESTTGLLVYWEYFGGKGGKVMQGEKI